MNNIKAVMCDIDGTLLTADYVTGDNDHDGIGVFIEKYLL